jgi:hypothetical protein
MDDHFHDETLGWLLQLFELGLIMKVDLLEGLVDHTMAFRIILTVLQRFHAVQQINIFFNLINMIINTRLIALNN